MTPHTDTTRRQLFRAAAAVGLGAALPGRTQEDGRAERARNAGDVPFRFCLNSATVRGHKLALEREIALAAAAGYDAVEPWTGAIRKAKDAGVLPDARARLSDAGMTVESAIGFARWIVDDDAAREKGLEDMKRDMDLVAALGGTRIACPPAGANRGPAIALDAVAERYRAVLELGEATGVVPQLEVWGFSANLYTLEQAAYVAVAADHPDACILPDVYHLFRGGGGFAGLRLLSGPGIPVFHVNDYPAEPSREQLNDGHRVYPGDGVAPMDRILADLVAGGTTTVLSLELFNRSYWQQDAATVMQTGLAKMKAAAARAAAG